MSIQNWLLLFLLSLLWGTSFLFIELAIESFTPLTLVFLRVTIAAIILFLWITYKKHKLPKSLRAWLPYFVMGLLANVIPFSLLIWGQTHISSSIAGILNGTTPIFALVFAHFLTKDEKLTLVKFLGVLLGFGGIYIMMSPTIKDGFSIEGIGQIAVIMACITYALCGIWGKRFNNTPPSLNASATLICSSIIMLPVMFAFDNPLSLTPTLTSIKAVLALAFLGSALAYIVCFKLIRDAGAANMSLVGLLVPINATLLGVFILGEDISLTTIIGMAVIIIGLVFVDGRIIKIFKNR